MSYRQPKYIAPADANEAIEKFNESMKSFADTAKQQNQQQWCRENPGACKDDEREEDDSTDNSKSKTSSTTSKALKPPMPKQAKPQGRLQLLNDDMEKYMINQEPQFKK
jgi:hypothetical protein